jgi:phosphatidylserine decarboxylase
MAKEGWPFVIPALIVLVIGAIALRSGWRGGLPVFLLGIVATAFLVFFFRDPERKAPDDPNAVVAPADGTVLSVVETPGGGSQIDIFLSVFNVHVNRAPVGGRVKSSEYHPGKFLVASRENAGTQNERQDVAIESSMGLIHYAQIAGTIARRIVCSVHVGDSLNTGQRVGMIRFGSRMQVVLPLGVAPTAHVGDKVRAGETVIARFEGRPLTAEARSKER